MQNVYHVHMYSPTDTRKPPMFLRTKSWTFRSLALVFSTCSPSYPPSHWSFKRLSFSVLTNMDLLRPFLAENVDTTGYHPTCKLICVDFAGRRTSEKIKKREGERERNRREGEGFPIRWVEGLLFARSMHERGFNGCLASWWILGSRLLTVHWWQPVWARRVGMETDLPFLFYLSHLSLWTIFPLVNRKRRKIIKRYNSAFQMTSCGEKSIKRRVKYCHFSYLRRIQIGQSANNLAKSRDDCDCPGNARLTSESRDRKARTISYKVARNTIPPTTTGWPPVKLYNRNWLLK